MATVSISSAAVVAFLAYLGALAVYRLYLHPLAKFPGPLLAGMTNLYAISYDIPLKTSYTKMFPEWVSND